MTDKDTIEHMRAKGYLKRWVLPEFDLNKEFKRFHGRPIGNSPELMPLDCSLFNDLDMAMCVHIAYTMTLDKKDPLKFTRATPRLRTESYLQDADPALGSVSSRIRLSRTRMWRLARPPPRASCRT